MSPDLTEVETAEAVEAPRTPARRPRPRRRVHAWVLASLVSTLVLLIAAAGAVRFGVLTDSGRNVAVRMIQGAKVGRMGRLQVEGLQGDLFGAFRVRRLAVVDERGAWIEARNLSVRWRPLELSARRVHADYVRAEVVRVIRRPIQTPPTGGGGSIDLSVTLDEVRTRLETLPDFSNALGIWDVVGQVDLNRGGVTTGRLDGRSRIHAGDGLRVAFRFGPEGRMLVQADAVEAMGGALAGSFGLPANQRLFVRGRVDGVMDGEGKLSLVAESGRLRPIVANGTWGPEGGALDARFLLGASDLTADYAARVGPEATVRLRARRLKDDLFQVDASALARDASVVMRGPIDWRRRRADGVELRLSVSEIQRWVGVLQAGPSRAQGTFSGTPSRWRYQGRLQIDALDQWGYRAGRFIGPATATRTPAEIRLEADLAGSGGQGEGLIPALLGPAPRVRLDGARLRDGRLLARALHVTGAGMQIDGDGDRNLLGTLTFKGKIALSQLERAHEGAAGVINSTFTARQRGRAPWAVEFDALGADFASGYPEFDRLLGTSPRLIGQATYGADGLAVSQADLTGESGQARLDGWLKPDATLAMNIDWQARGPFTVGPVEIAGEAYGKGQVGGQVGTPWVDLNADLAAVDVGQLVVRPAKLDLHYETAEGGSGRLALTGPTEYGFASGSADFRFIPDGLALSRIAADAGGLRASGALELRNGAPSTADLRVAAGPGAFLTSGRISADVRIAETGGGAVARIVLEGQDLAARNMDWSMRSIRLRADGPWNRLPFEISAESGAPQPWRFAGDGVLAQSETPAGMVREVSLSGAGRLRRADLRTLEPARLRFGPDQSAIRLRLGLGGGEVDVDARRSGEALEAAANLAGVDLAAFFEDYVGRITAALRVYGRGARLGGELEANIQGGRNRDAPQNAELNGQVRARLEDTRMLVDASATNALGLTSKLDMVMPTEATAAPFRVAVVRNRPVSGSFAAQGELRPLWDLLIGGGRTLSGKGVTEGTIGGTLADLDAVGQASITGGRFEDAATGLDLRDLALQARFGESAVHFDQFKGVDAEGGSVSGSGEVNLERGGASTFTLNLDRFQLIDNDLARAVASGAVTVTRDAQGKARLEGELNVVRADITAEPPVPTGVTPLDVVEVNKAVTDQTSFQVRPRGPEVALDVRITAPRGVFVRGNGLDLEFSVDAHVGGATGGTLLTGDARVVRGNYQFAGKRFEFDERSVVRLGSQPELIRLDLTAVREDPTLTAIVRIEGTAARPEITLSSTPVLPQDEVLSQVLFGRTASQLTPLETAQLASALASLATGGGLDVLGGLRELAGLDRLALGGDAEGQSTVSGGKYLTDDVYLELTGGGRQGPTAQVEWRVRRNFSIVSTVGTRGDARLSVRFRRGR